MYGPTLAADGVGVGVLAIVGLLVVRMLIVREDIQLESDIFGGLER